MGPEAPVFPEMPRRHLPLVALLIDGIALVLAPAAFGSTLPAPVVSGVPAPGQVLTCTPVGGLPGVSFTWQRDLTAPVGSATDQYTVTSADVGHTIECTVTATVGLISVSVQSLPLPIPVPLPLSLFPVNTALPSISGSTSQGSAVSCLPGSWTSTTPVTYAYSWLRDATAIAGVSGPSYTLTAADVGQAITCMVVAANSAGSSLPAISLPILPGASGVTGGSGGSGGGGSVGSGAAPGSPSGGQEGAPVITAFSITPHRIVVSVKGRHQSTRGATFRYHLSHAGAVFIVIERRVRGGRYVKVAQLVVRGARAGHDWLRWRARIGRRMLAGGAYKAVIVAVDAAGWSRTRSVRFTVRHKVTRRR